MSFYSATYYKIFASSFILTKFIGHSCNQDNSVLEWLRPINNRNRLLNVQMCSYFQNVWFSLLLRQFLQPIPDLEFANSCSSHEVIKKHWMFNEWRPKRFKMSSFLNYPRGKDLPFIYSISRASQLYLVLLKHSSSLPQFFILLRIKDVQEKEKSKDPPLTLILLRREFRASCLGGGGD